jgi:2-hydroxy-6-oxonona-2,4-dienedioate hydrolase
MEAWYERFTARIGYPVERQVAGTSFGPSHVLLAGPVAGPPLVCLHAMRTGAAHLLSELGPLLERFRVIAPDLPGHSVRGPQVRLSLSDDSHARWLFEVLDELDVEHANLFGVSWGGFVARLAASTDPGRVRRLALLVPAGIVNGSHLQGLVRMALPMLRYRLSPTDRNLQSLLAPLLTSWDADWAAFMGESLRDVALDLRIPPLATDDQLRSLSMPTLVLGAELDISFPGHPMSDRVRRLVPDVEEEVLPSCRHCPPTTPEFRTWLADRLTTFYGADECDV